MGKILICSEIKKEDSLYMLGDKVTCDLWPPNIIMPNEPHDWREAASSAAVYEGFVLKESDLVDVKSYLLFKIRNSVFFKNKIILNDFNLKLNLPEEAVVIGGQDGFPLMACWEEDF